jgi:oligoribonuclease
MTIAKDHLIWIDCEMTGLNPNHDVLIEIATIITDSALNILATGPVLAIKQADKYLANMDAWNTEHHGNSGLTERVKASVISEAQAEQQTLEFLKQWVPASTSPMCGNTICQDRRFLANYMPELESFFHYRNLDVSSFKILAQYWAPEIAAAVKKTSAHRALDDIQDSINELRYYKDYWIEDNTPDIKDEK